MLKTSFVLLIFLLQTPKNSQQVGYSILQLFTTLGKQIHPVQSQLSMPSSLPSDTWEMVVLSHSILPAQHLTQPNTHWEMVVCYLHSPRNKNGRFCHFFSYQHDKKTHSPIYSTLPHWEMIVCYQHSHEKNGCSCCFFFYLHDIKDSVCHSLYLTRLRNGNSLSTLSSLQTLVTQQRSRKSNITHLETRSSTNRSEMLQDMMKGFLLTLTKYNNDWCTGFYKFQNPPNKLYSNEKSMLPETDS